jgi:predicted  nucleic acid-binding Zn-ribbon protein
MSDYLLKALRSTAKAGSLLPPYPEVINAAAARIEQLEKQLVEANRQIKELENELDNIEYEMCELGNRND